MAAQRGIILLNLEALGMELFVFGGGVTRRRLPLFARFRALNRNDFARHKLFFLFGRFFFGFFFFGGFPFASGGSVDAAKLPQPTLAQGAFFFKLRLGLDREARPRNGSETRLRNRLARQFADAIG